MSMKVLYVIPDMSFGGGAEQALMHLMPAMKRLGVEVELAALSPPSDLGPQLREQGIPVHVLDLRSWDLATGPIKISSLILRGHYDIIHAQLFFAALHVGASRLLSSKAKHVITFQNLDYDIGSPTFRRTALKQLHKLVMHGFDFYTAVSRAVAAHHQHHLGLPKVNVVYNPLDIRLVRHLADELPAETRSRYGVSEKEFMAVVPLRFVKQKGHKYLLHALARLRQQAMMPRVLMFGSGPTWDSIKGEIRALGLDGQVTMHRSVPQSEILKVVHAADLFVSPSEQEGFPLSHAEAMALGTPVLATPVGGVPEFIENGRTGLLIAPADIHALQQGLERLILDCNLRKQLSRNAYQEIGQIVDVTRISEQWYQIYQQMLNN